jgi:hypothetical protein
VLLIVLGAAGLMMQTVTETKNVLTIWPLELRSQEQHRFPLPTIAGVVAVVAGLGILFASQSSVRS